MQTTAQSTAQDVAVEIDDEVLASLLGDDASVSQLIEEQADTSMLPSAASVIVLSIVVKC
ncbi:hypothetical protein O7623_03935 [Solwaraspora sp. WMMD791]|uniref:hypothetical protein n=1 Tax=Solwaraspora sp. WMMD791 TaxID=3016086 RepID=UPI00249C4AC0|nr:hypothetical protein [Solwaraspora sp. WMMD791]WFE28372.1 hypothetical protein O7623_03935 [Solwaraspora sp. WMMD791]